MDREALTEEVLEKINSRKHNIHHSDRRREGHRTVIHYLASKGGKALSGEISSDVGISTPRLAYILKELEADGIISRAIKEDDKRKVCVTLTDKGMERISHRHRDHKKKIRKCLDKLSMNDMEALKRILDVFEEFENGDD